MYYHLERHQVKNPTCLYARCPWSKGYVQYKKHSLIYNVLLSVQQQHNQVGRGQIELLALSLMSLGNYMAIAV